MEHIELDYKQLQEMIPQRKSVRSYTDTPVDAATLAEIEAAIAAMKPLYPEIPVHAEILPRENVRCILPWLPPQALAIYTASAPNDLENVGFLYQQLDLYLQSRGLGACWLGMGKPAKTTQEGFAMVLAFGYPKGEARRSSPEEFRRKTLAEIADRPDTRLEPARLAPSSVNSQPWYFTHDDQDDTVFHAYCALPRLLPKKVPSAMNRIDMGIALAHLFVSNPDTFRFFPVQQPNALKHHVYTGSFRIA